MSQSVPPLILDFIPFIHSLWCPAHTLQNICVAHTLYSHSQLGSTSGTKNFLDIVEEVQTVSQTSQISRLFELLPILNPSWHYSMQPDRNYSCHPAGQCGTTCWVMTPFTWMVMTRYDNIYWKWLFIVYCPAGRCGTSWVPPSAGSLPSGPSVRWLPASC